MFEDLFEAWENFELSLEDVGDEVHDDLCWRFLHGNVRVADGQGRDPR